MAKDGDGSSREKYLQEHQLETLRKRRIMTKSDFGIYLEVWMPWFSSVKRSMDSSY